VGTVREDLQRKRRRLNYFTHDQARSGIPLGRRWPGAFRLMGKLDLQTILVDDDYGERKRKK